MLFGGRFAFPPKIHYLCHAGGAGRLLLFSCPAATEATGLRQGDGLWHGQKPPIGRPKAINRKAKDHNGPDQQQPARLTPVAPRFSGCRDFLRFSVFFHPSFRAHGNPAKGMGWCHPRNAVASPTVDFCLFLTKKMRVLFCHLDRLQYLCISENSYLYKNNYYETNIIAPRCRHGQPLWRLEAVGRPGPQR